MSVFMFDAAPDAEKAAYLAGRKDGLLAAAEIANCYVQSSCKGGFCDECASRRIRAAAEESG